MEIGIRRIGPGEGHVLQDVRLRALSDSPTAFASTFDEEVGHDDAFWADRARRGSTGCDTATSADVVELWVTEGNLAAITLYRALGFEPTGERGPLPSDPSLDELCMRRLLR